MKTTTYTIRFYSIGSRSGNVLFHLIKDKGTVAHKIIYTGEKNTVECVLKEILSTEKEVVVISKEINDIIPSISQVLFHHHYGIK